MAVEEQTVQTRPRPKTCKQNKTLGDWRATLDGREMSRVNPTKKVVEIKEKAVRGL